MEQTKVTLANIESQITAWLHEQSGSGNEALIAEMIRTLIKLARDGTSRGDLKILNRALKELRQAFKVFAPYDAVRKVSIFGSTHIKEHDPYYSLAKELADRLGREQFMGITSDVPGL